MDTVLGLSMTSAGVAWVLMQGTGPDAVTLDHDHFSVADTATDGDISRHEAAVRGACAIAEASGHRVTSIGVTWSDDVEAKATLLVKALPDMGFADVVTVPLADATQTWAHAFGRTLGFERCALCVVEPSAVTVVSVLYNFVRTATTPMRESADGIGRWLTSVFDLNRSQPESLYLLGARGDLELISATLDEALPIPVVPSDDAQLALARGAALSVETKLAERAQPPTATQKTVRLMVSRPRAFAKIGPHARAAAVVVAGLIGLAALAPALVGDSNDTGDTAPASRTSVTPEAAAASVPATPSVSIHAVPSAPVTVQRAAAPLPAPAVTVPVPEQPVQQPVEALVVTEEPLPEVVEPAAVAPLANAPEMTPPMPEAPPPAEPLPPAPVPPPDPLQVVLSPLFGGLP